MSRLHFGAIPPDLVDEFNKVFQVDDEQLKRELAQTDVILSVPYRHCCLHYGTRQSDGRAIIIFENSGFPHLLILPEGCG